MAMQLDRSIGQKNAWVVKVLLRAQARRNREKISPLFFHLAMSAHPTIVAATMGQRACAYLRSVSSSPRNRHPDPSTPKLNDFFMLFPLKEDLKYALWSNNPTQSDPFQNAHWAHGYHRCPVPLRAWPLPHRMRARDRRRWEPKRRTIGSDKACQTLLKMLQQPYE